MKYGMKVELFSKGEHWVLKEDAEARIKELEAELEDARCHYHPTDEQIEIILDRAEKAEAELADWIEDDYQITYETAALEEKVRLLSQSALAIGQRNWRIRAEKAEAEVERLRLREEYYLRQLTSRVAGPRAIDWRKRADADLLLKGVNPSGGRESGGAKGEKSLGPSKSAAADPAAHRLCWDEPCSECEAEETAARKERDG